MKRFPVWPYKDTTLVDMKEWDRVDYARALIRRYNKMLFAMRGCFSFYKDHKNETRSLHVASGASMKFLLSEVSLYLEGTDYEVIDE